MQFPSLYLDDIKICYKIRSDKHVVGVTARCGYATGLLT